MDINIEYLKFLVDNRQKASDVFDANPNEETGLAANIAAAQLGNYATDIIKAYITEHQMSSEANVDMTVLDELNDYKGKR